MADLSVFSNIEMRDEHMKLLEMNANTFWDYIAHDDFGTTRIFPQEDRHLLDGFKWITDQSVIYYLDLNVLVVRFPIVGYWALLDSSYALVVILHSVNIPPRSVFLSSISLGCVALQRYFIRLSPSRTYTFDGGSLILIY
eukprot:1031522_1